jgi:hypothetical protein
MTTKKPPETTEIPAAEAARRLGLTAQSVGAWAKRPGAPARADGRALLVQWPAFARWREQQLIAGAMPGNVDTLRARKLLAESELAELTLAERRRDLAPVAEMDAAVEHIALAVRNEVRGLRSRFVARLVGLTSEAEAARELDAMGDQILEALVERVAPPEDEAEAA